MKNFIKNNLKVFVTLVISGIVFTGIGVYAASQYFAKDITFTPINENFKKENGEAIDNVEDALNELYKKNYENKSGSDFITVGSNYSSNFTGNAEYIIVSDKYKYFNIKQSGSANGVSTIKKCYTNNWTSSEDIQLNTVYNVSDCWAIVDYVKSNSGGTWSNMGIEFFN